MTVSALRSHRSRTSAHRHDKQLRSSRKANLFRWLAARCDAELMGFPHGWTVRDSPGGGTSLADGPVCEVGSRLVALPLDGAVDGGAADAEELSDLGGAVVTAVDQR